MPETNSNEPSAEVVRQATASHPTTKQANENKAHTDAAGAAAAKLLKQVKERDTIVNP